jgi:diacylglycerol kinase (ATP)
LNPTYVVNMTAGRGRTRQTWPQLARLVGSSADVRFTEGPGHATELAAAAAAAGAECVVAVGGDGTAAEVATGLIGTEVPMAIVPTGAGCDIARGIGLPNDPQESLRRLLQGALSVRPLDVGMVNDRVFLTVAGVGFDAEVAAEDARTRRPGMGGTWPYLLAILRVLARYRPTPLLLRLDGVELSGRFLLVALCNTQFYAGGMRIAPYAVPDDGLLDVVAVGDLTVLETLTTLPRVYSAGHTHDPKIRFERAAQVEVESPDSLVVHAGGEIVGTTPIRASVRPGAISVFGGTPPAVMARRRVG